MSKKYEAVFKDLLTEFPFVTEWRNGAAYGFAVYAQYFTGTWREKMSTFNQTKTKKTSCALKMENWISFLSKI